jgi:hypothetical protein
MAGIEKVKGVLGAGDGPSSASLERIRRVSGEGGKTGRDALKKGMAQSPSTRKQGSDKGLSLSIARELLPYAGGRQQLQAMFRDLSPQAQENFLTAIAHQTRAADSPADGFSLSQEGQAIHDIVLNDSMSPDTINFVRDAGSRVRNSGDPVRQDTDLNEISAEEDFSEKSAPDRPSTGDRKFPAPSDSPSFRSTETPKMKADGTFEVKHSDQHFDRQTQSAVAKGGRYEKYMAAREAAIRKALLKEYGTQEAINAAPTEEVAEFIDFIDLSDVLSQKEKNAELLAKYGSKEAVDAADPAEKQAFIESLSQPAPRPAAIPDQNSSGRGGALAASMKPEENYTKAMHRLAETRDPHTGISHDGSVIEGEVAAGVPSSVFAPGGTRGVQGPTIATVRPQDHADLMQFARRLGLKSPNELGSAEEFARALVSGGHQEGFNITPVTPSQRADATDLVGDLADDASGITPTAAGRTLRTYMPAEAKAASAAERALLQEQAIQTIARKAEAVFGHQGWGENYRPSTRPAGTDGPSTEGPSLAGTTQDAGNVPAVGGQPNRRVESDAPPPALRDYKKPGVEIGEDVELDDLADLQDRQTFATGREDAASLADGEADSVVRKGYAEGDKAKTTPSKPREEGGNKPGEYADDQNFAQYNAENPATTPDELARRQQVYDNMKPRMQAEHDSARSSDLRRQIRELIESNPQPGPEVISQISTLNKKLRMSERLDMQSGVKSSKAEDPGTGMIPSKGNDPVEFTDPAELQGSDLSAAETDIGPASTRPNRVWYQDENGNWVEGEPFEYTGRPMDDGNDGNLPPPNDPPRLNGPEPDQPSRNLASDPEAPKKKGWSRYSKAAAIAGGVGALIGGYNAVQKGGQPEPHEFTPNSPAEGGGVPVMANGSIGPATSESRIRALNQFLRSGRINADTQTLQNWTN